MYSELIVESVSPEKNLLEAPGKELVFSSVMTYLSSFFKISLIDLLVPMEDDLICVLIFVEFFRNAFAINDSLFLAFRDNELDDSVEPCQRKKSLLM